MARAPVVEMLWNEGGEAGSIIRKSSEKVWLYQDVSGLNGKKNQKTNPDLQPVIRGHAGEASWLRFHWASPSILPCAASLKLASEKLSSFKRFRLINPQGAKEQRSSARKLKASHFCMDWIKILQSSKMCYSCVTWCFKKWFNEGSIRPFFQIFELVYF